MLADCYDTEQAGLTEKIEQYEREGRAEHDQLDKILVSKRKRSMANTSRKSSFSTACYTISRRSMLSLCWVVRLNIIPRLATIIVNWKTDFLLNIANKISTLDFFENLRCLRFFSERLLYQKAVQNKAICIPESKSQPLGLQAGTLVIAAEILEIAETTDEIALIIAVVVATSEQGLI